MIKAILLDVYGTLIDSPTYASTYSNLLSHVNLSSQQIAQAWRGIMSKDFPAVQSTANWIEETFSTPPIPNNLIQQIEEEISAHLMSFSLIPGCEVALAQLRERNFRLVLVSNLATPYKEPIQRLGIADCMEHAIYSCDVGCMKPDSEIFNKAINKLGLKPEEAMMIGDDEHADIAGARAVGVHGILIEAGYTGGGSSIVGSIAEVPAIFH